MRAGAGADTETVAGSPFRCEVLELGAKESRPGGLPAQVQRRESRMVGVKETVRGAPAHFHVDPKGLDGHIDMEVLGKACLARQSALAFTVVKTTTFFLVNVFKDTVKKNRKFTTIYWKICFRLAVVNLQQNVVSFSTSP